MSSSKQYPYDVAFSYAGEDRDHVEPLAKILKEHGVKVFYDKYEKSPLWGKNLYTHLSDVYQNQALFCVMFLSKNYSTKVWTNREREAAQARALSENEEYILPIRLDDTQIPGMLPTLAYLSWPPETVETIADAILEKLLIIKSDEDLKDNKNDSKLPSQESLIKLAQQNSPTLVFMAGLPGSGKTTLALALSRKLRWQVVEKDWNKSTLMTIEVGVTEEQLGIHAYELTFATVEDLIKRQQLSIIFDSAGIHQFIIDEVRRIVEDTKARLKIILCVADRDVRHHRLSNMSPHFRMPYRILCNCILFQPALVANL